MNSPSRLNWSVITTVAIPVTGLLVALSSVSPGEAGSNLANWLTVAGIDNVPNFINNSIANTVVQLCATAALSSLATVKFMNFLNARSNDTLIDRQNAAYRISEKMDNLREYIEFKKSRREDLDLAEIMPDLYVIRQDMLLIGIDLPESIVDREDQQSSIGRVVNTFKFIAPMLSAGHIKEAKKILAFTEYPKNGSGA